MDVRQYNRYGPKVYPTKQGVHLTRAQLTKLLIYLEEINRDLAEYQAGNITEFKYNIGGGLHVTASDGFPVIHIRLYYQNPEMPFALPTKVGMALHYPEWNLFVSLLEELLKKVKLTERK